jgi:hypothetical protein
MLKEMVEFFVLELLVMLLKDKIRLKPLKYSYMKCYATDFQFS